MCADKTLLAPPEPPLVASEGPIFSLFINLPFELRLQVWQLACASRVVQLRYDSAKDQCHSPTKPPAILHACSESREEALRMYPLLFRTHKHPAAIYFNPSLDVLYFPRDPGFWTTGYGHEAADFGHYVLDTAPHIQRVAFDYVPPAICRPWEPYYQLCFLQWFPQRRETFLVVGSGGTSGLEEEQAAVGDAEAAQKVLELIDMADDSGAVWKLMSVIRSSFLGEVYHSYIDDPRACEDDQVETCAVLKETLGLVPKAKRYF